MILRGKTQADVDKENRIAELEKTIADAKRFLSETDWVVVKLSEAEVTAPDTVGLLLEKYKNTLDERETMRQTINKAEEDLANEGIV